eukprot:524653_1
MAGIYNGNLSDYKGNGNYKNTSHRAQIPGINSFYIKTFASEYNITWLGAAIDLVNSVVYNRSTIYHPTKCPKPIDIQITQYTHKYFRSLLIFNISVINTSINEDIYCEIPLAHCNLNSTLDFKWSEQKSSIIPNTKTRSLQTLVKENINSTLINVGIAYQMISDTIIFNTSNTTTVFQSYYSVFHNSLPDDTNINNSNDLTKLCETELNTYLTNYTPQQIYNIHQSSATTLWNKRIEFNGNDTITKGIYASYYYLMNAIRFDYPFTTSPGGINSNSYNGHAFWDAETWMLPTIIIINPSLASIMLQYRLNRIYTAQWYLIQNGYTDFIGDALQYPWESSYSGENVCRETQTYANHEQHIIGDIGQAIKLFYMTTMNDTWLFNSSSIPPLNINYEKQLKIKYNFMDMLNQSCNFFMNRFTKMQNNKYTINNVVPPDEKAGIQNSSIYTNGIATSLIKFCLNISDKYKLYIPSNIRTLWIDIVENTYIPMSNKLPDSNGELLHLEYEAYNGQSVNQADVALLQYPLRYFNTDTYDEFFMNYNKTILINDLIYYEIKTEQGNSAHFFTGDSSYSIAWLKLLNNTNAQIFFDNAFDHMDTKHFYIFREKDSSDGGNLNFLTGIGGLLQNCLFGYGGAMITSNYLYLNPSFPMVKSSNITSIKFHNLVYRGVIFMFEFDMTKNQMSLELKDVTKSNMINEGYVNQIQSLRVELLNANYDTNTLIVEKTMELNETVRSLTNRIQLCRLTI